jgi:hypothetical protein
MPCPGTSSLCSKFEVSIRKTSNGSLNAVSHVMLIVLALIEVLGSRRKDKVATLGVAGLRVGLPELFVERKWGRVIKEVSKNSKKEQEKESQEKQTKGQKKIAKMKGKNEKNKEQKMNRRK